MSSRITVSNLNTSDDLAIRQIAEWYSDEWGIPVTTTIERLSHQSSDDVVFHFVASLEGKVIATGGLHKNVGILKVHPRLEKLGPWVAVLYTTPEYRKQGIGELLLSKIEERAKEMGFSKIYLYTYTAENLYRKCGWNVIERVQYKGHSCALMEKYI